MTRTTLSPQSKEAMRLCKELKIVPAGVIVRAGTTTIFDSSGAKVLFPANDQDASRQQTAEDEFEAWNAARAK
jgi:hypothetical protein